MNTPLFGTIHHGYFDDIGWGADYYSGHLVYQRPGFHQLTDLLPVDPEINVVGQLLTVCASIITPLGPITKTWTLDANDSTLTLRLKIDWPDCSKGRFRIYPITLYPNSFLTDSLAFKATNGGDKAEVYALAQHSINHGKEVSFLVSSHQGLGLTDGVIDLFDSTKGIHLSFNPADSALLGQVTHLPVDNTWFTRLALSAQELDDTSKNSSLILDTTIRFTSYSY